MVHLIIIIIMAPQSAKVYSPIWPVQMCGALTQKRTRVASDAPSYSQPASVPLLKRVSQQQATHGALNGPSDDTRLIGDPARRPEQLG